jgi:hypothetical protein
MRGNYALPLQWRERVIGWGNLAVVDGRAPRAELSPRHPWRRLVNWTP